MRTASSQDDTSSSNNHQPQRRNCRHIAERPHTSRSHKDKGALARGRAAAAALGNGALRDGRRRRPPAPPPPQCRLRIHRNRVGCIGVGGVVGGDAARLHLLLDAPKILARCRARPRAALATPEAAILGGRPRHPRAAAAAEHHPPPRHRCRRCRWPPRRSQLA